MPDRVIILVFRNRRIVNLMVQIQIGALCRSREAAERERGVRVLGLQGTAACAVGGDESGPVDHEAEIVVLDGVVAGVALHATALRDLCE